MSPPADPGTNPKPESVPMKPSVAPAVALPPTPPMPAVQELKIGDTAPPLTIAHWVRGEPVKSFESGKVYVVEFWATWCAPCIAGIPKLTEIQAKYKDKGLVVIGVSSSDRKGVEDVRPFVEKMDDRMNYTVAVDDNFATGRAYTMATGQNSIPIAYLINKAGKLAWFGHPQAMEPIIEQLVNDKAPDVAAMTKGAQLAALSDQLRQQLALSKWDKVDEVFAKIKETDPSIIGQMDTYRFIVLLNNKQDRAEAYAYAREIMSQTDKGTIRTDWRNLSAIAANLSADPKLDEPGAMLMTDAALQALNLTGQKNTDVLQIAAEAYRRASRPQVASRLLSQAIGLASDENQRKALEAKLAALDAEQRKTK